MNPSTRTMPVPRQSAGAPAASRSRLSFHDASMIEVEICNRQKHVPVSAPRLRQAVRHVLDEEGLPRAEISLAVVDDATIHRLNRRYLNHDWPTDVLSFVLERTGDWLSGEVIVSGEHAARRAPKYGWKPADELLLYVVHGMLHLCGYDDRTAAARRKMRRREQAVLAEWGLCPRYDGRASGRQGPGTAPPGED